MTFTCLICGESFPSERLLGRHKLVHCRKLESYGMKA